MFTIKLTLGLAIKVSISRKTLNEIICLHASKCNNSMRVHVQMCYFVGIKRTFKVKIKMKTKKSFNCGHTMKLGKHILDLSRSKVVLEIASNVRTNDKAKVQPGRNSSI